jgi:hypothetical protein
MIHSRVNFNSHSNSTASRSRVTERVCIQLLRFARRRAACGSEGPNSSSTLTNRPNSTPQASRMRTVVVRLNECWRAAA